MPRTSLVELYAHGLGVLDDVRVEFGPGFNVLTGETGAGKTLLLDALDLCLGGDGATSRQAVHSDMRASAVFVGADGVETVLARDRVSGGRMRSTRDGAATSAEALRLLAGELIVIHGQHDSLKLRSRAEVLKIVDASGGVSTEELDAVRRALHLARARRDGLGGEGPQREREMEFLEYQIAELEAAKILSGDELTNTLDLLARMSELRDAQSALAQIVEELDGDAESVLLNRLAALIERIPSGGPFEAPREALRGALAQARDGGHELARLADPDAVDDGAIAALNERAQALAQVARKYGGTLDAALALLDDLRRQRNDRRDEGALAAALDEEMVALAQRECELAAVARLERRDAAERLTAAVAAQLPRVALANATLRVEVDGDDGSEVQILFSANPGFDPGPLQALASGGELSRVLLALSLETVHDDVVAVFDEVDAGIGGQVAQQIGDCLRELGQRQQVLAVTHLASVAAKADHHYVIDKSVHRGATTTTIRALSGEQRVFEIARMLAGDESSDESRALAQRLLETPR